MPRGGKRTGKQGASYGNRSDLQQGPRALPVQTATGQEYGKATEQREAQQAVPMASGPLGDPMASAQAFNPPPVVPMGAPTARPDEPITAGIPTGPGPNTPPRLFGSMAQPPLLKAAALLNTLGDDASPEVKALRDAINASQGNQGAP